MYRNQNQLMEDQLETVSLNTNNQLSLVNRSIGEQQNKRNELFISLKIYLGGKWSILAIIILIIIFLNSMYNKISFKHQVELSLNNEQSVVQPIIKNLNNKSDGVLVGRLPKYFWIYTQNQFQSEQMNSIIYLYHFNDTANKFGYSVRMVNSWNSYDYLSESTIARITKARQNCKVDEPVHNILKLALLMENGGVIINQNDVSIRGQNFKWIQDMFERRKFTQTVDPLHVCQPEKSYLYITSSHGHQFSKKYDSFIMAAVPNSDILKQSFETLLNFMETGTFPYNDELNLLRENKDTNISYSINSLDDSINTVIYRYLNNNTQSEHKNICQRYGIQERKAPNIVNMIEFNEDDKLQILKKENLDELFRKKSDRYHVRIIRGMNSGPMSGILNSIIENQINNDNKYVEHYMENSILWDVLNAPGNKQIFLSSLPPREIQLCLVVFDDLDRESLTDSLNTFISQEMKNWKQVLFAKDINNVPQINDNRIFVVQSSFNEVRNIEIAMTKYCHPKGYAVLLHRMEKFNHNNALTVIAKAVQQRDIVGAFISLQKNNKIIQGKLIPRFERRQDAIVKPNIPKLQQILNHFRIISIQSFRYIPQFDLRNIYGDYFKDRTIFLMTLLQMIRRQIHEPRMFYVIKKYAQQWNVPRKSIQIDSDTFIKIKKKEEIDRQQLIKTRSRLSCQDLVQSFEQLFNFKIPFSKMIVLNNGDQFVPANKKKGSQIIPKIIHQVWLGTEILPPAKQYFYRKTQVMYPNYQLKLWRQQNITKQAFPFTYDIIRTIIDFNKNSPYNKLATVTDIIRHEIMYHQGGFWKDAGMNLLRPIFDDFTRYKLVIAADKTFRYRWLQGMCFFANVPNLENMFRITNYRNINRMRIYYNYALNIAGPIDFRQLLVGQQEYDSQVLTMPYETFYPAQVTEHPQKDLCTKRFQELQQDDIFEIVQNEWYLLQKCNKLYPYAYAVEHNRFGDSWSKRHTKKKKSNLLKG